MRTSGARTSLVSIDARTTSRNSIAGEAIRQRAMAGAESHSIYFVAEIRQSSRAFEKIHGQIREAYFWRDFSARRRLQGRRVAVIKRRRRRSACAMGRKKRLPGLGHLAEARGRQTNLAAEGGRENGSDRKTRRSWRSPLRRCWCSRLCDRRVRCVALARTRRPSSRNSGGIPARDEHDERLPRPRFLTS